MSNKPGNHDESYPDTTQIGRAHQIRDASDDPERRAQLIRDATKNPVLRAWFVGMITTDPVQQAEIICAITPDDPDVQKWLTNQIRTDERRRAQEKALAVEG